MLIMASCFVDDVDDDHDDVTLTVLGGPREAATEASAAQPAAVSLSSQVLHAGSRPTRRRVHAVGGAVIAAYSKH